MSSLPLFPQQASTVAASVDNLYFFLIAISVFFAVLIFSVVLFFAVRYHRSNNPKAEDIHGNNLLEIIWTVIPFLISMVLFAWATKVYFTNARPPANAVEMFVVGKQWMWKLQHPEGRREINELHVPLGQPVKLTMTSEDVIHSFYVPAFRVKMDVLPGRYSSLWFQPTKAGEYHLFCAEYCGTNHSRMIGRVIVMQPAEYETWLSGHSASGSSGSGESMVSRGEKLFRQFNCQTCHNNVDTARAPILQGIFGKDIELEGGRIVKADDAYLRESILNPASKVVKGYQPVMPLYSTQMSEEQVMQILAYLKTDMGQQKGN